MNILRRGSGLSSILWCCVCLAQAAPDPATSTAAIESSWLAQAQQELAQREYHAGVSEQGLQAPNRAQGFRSYFDATGVRVVTRDAESRTLATLTLAGFARADADAPLQIEALDDATVAADNAQVSLQWPEHSLRFHNLPEGLQHEFVLDRRSAGAGRLVIAIDVSAATPLLGIDEVVLSSAAGSLRLGAFSAHDAQGMSLLVTLEVEGQRLLMQMDDHAAKYPITLKSLLSGIADARLQSNQANAQLGTSVGGAGDVNGDGFADVIVGAPFYDNGQTNEGAAFIYFGGAGAFDTAADALLQSDQASAQFGTSVAGAGDLNGDGFADVIVGAQFYDNGESNEGAAFVYFGGAGVFNTTVDALLESNQANARLGSSVAGAGDLNGDGFADVIVGAPFFDNGEADEGAAFIYFGGTGSFNTAIDALLESNQAFTQLGSSVAGAGDINGDGFADVIVGAPAYTNGQADEGAAYVYFGGAGAFNTTADAQMESNLANANFGNSVAGAGDVNGDGFADVIVGAPSYNDGQLNEGAALIYFGSAGAFNTTPDALFESNQIGAELGRSVAGAGDVNGDGYADVIVGALGYDDDQVDEGAVFVYLGGAGAFDTSVYKLLYSNQVGAQLGGSVAGVGDLNGDGFADIIAGAAFYDNGESSEGGAFVYFGGAASFSLSADALLQSNQIEARLATSVAGAGDVNGDGFADVIVGAPLYDNGQTSEGAAFLYFGGASGLNTTADALLQSNDSGAQAGSSVASAGDVNGDGFADVIVGAPFLDIRVGSEGGAFIYFGGAGAFDTTADAILETRQPYSQMGASVAGAGDLNGDGFADVIVGAPRYDNGQSDEGVAFIYFGGPGDFNIVSVAQMEANQADTLFGSSVASAGDVNGDGFADVIVGARFFDNGQTDEGVAFVYFGSAGSFNTTADALLQSNQTDAAFGVSVAGAGDVNGDGFADVIVGASGYDNGQNLEGAAFLYFGGAGAFNTTADAVLESNQAVAILGISVAGAGDVNGDGFADLIAGAPTYDNGENAEGIAFIYFGGSGMFNTTFDVLLEPNQIGASFGGSVAGAGDINGDGFADVIVGAPFYDNGQDAEGSAFVYFGTARGRLVLAEQYRGDASSPVQPGGLSQQADGFVVALNATGPRGRERVRLQLDACPNGAPFGSLLCNRYTSASWTELGANPLGTTLTLSATDLAVDRIYHWRARVQYAALTGPVPANPPGGPWRRLQANVGVADIRTSTPPSPEIFTDGFEFQ